MITQGHDPAARATTEQTRQQIAQHLLRQVPFQSDPLWARQLEREAERLLAGVH